MVDLSVGKTRLDRFCFFREDLLALNCLRAFCGEGNLFLSVDGRGGRKATMEFGLRELYVFFATLFMN